MSKCIPAVGNLLSFILTSRPLCLNVCFKWGVRGGWSKVPLVLYWTWSKYFNSNLISMDSTRPSLSGPPDSLSIFFPPRVVHFSLSTPSCPLCPVSQDIPVWIPSKTDSQFDFKFNYIKFKWGLGTLWLTRAPCWLHKVMDPVRVMLLEMSGSLPLFMLSSFLFFFFHCSETETALLKSPQSVLVAPCVCMNPLKWMFIWFKCCKQKYLSACCLRCLYWFLPPLIVVTESVFVVRKRGALQNKMLIYFVTILERLLKMKLEALRERGTDREAPVCVS